MGLKFQSVAEREKTLEGLNLNDNIGAPTYPVYWKKQHLDLKIQRVPIEFPFFNLSNARTKDTQAEYISIHNKSDNFFKTLDDLQAQESQYEILKNNYVKTTGESISSILYKNLKNGEQTEPLVLTKDYKVLSGNRRLCIMRGLDETAIEKRKPRNFEFIKVVFLEGGTEKDERALEYYLEEQRTGKVEFSWTSRAMSIREDKETMDWNEIVEIRHEAFQQRAKALTSYKEQLQMINYADKYLKSIDKPLQYGVIAEAEFAFKGLVAGLKKENVKNDRAKKSLAIDYCFDEITNSVGGNKFKTIRAFFENFDDYWKKAKGKKKIEKNPITGLEIEFIEKPTLSDEDKIKIDGLVKERSIIEKKVNKITKALGNANTYLTHFLDYYQNEDDEKIKSKALNASKPTVKKLYNGITKIQKLLAELGEKK